jgi:demethylmenaquinone methyltransferase/2-methoxy-6-polyprenyl-1,4-benzoquinol methylase
MMKNTTHFGFKEVATQDKQSMVRGVFDSVANRNTFNNSNCDTISELFIGLCI